MHGLLFFASKYISFRLKLEKSSSLSKHAKANVADRLTPARQINIMFPLPAIKNINC